MLATRKKRDLFGGALRCAGLALGAVVSSNAMADFVPAVPASTNYTGFYTADFNIIVLASNYEVQTGAVFPDASSYAGAYGTITAYAGSSAMGTSMTSTAFGWSYAGALLQQYFTVEESKSVRLSWDLLHTSVFAYASVYGFGVGYIANAASGTTGSLDLVLNPGTTYVFVSHALLFFPAPGTSAFVTLENVPAPGALALLGIGMIGKRRRRV